MRTAAAFISSPSAGMAESPIPGRSGAMTVNRSARDGIKGPPHQRGFRVAVQQEKGRTVPGCQVVQLDALDIGVARSDRFGGPGAC